jgi:hypothetical protein
MNLVDQFVQSLAQPHLSGSVLEVRAGGERLWLGIEQTEPLAVSFTQLGFESSKLLSAKVERLRSIANDLVQGVTYLLEPLTLVEIDHDSAVVQLRSATPERDGEGRTYYEILVKRSGVTLERYRKEPGAMRTAISATVTREVLKHLAADFVASVG